MFAAGIAAAMAGCGDGVEAGAGPFADELAACQLRIFDQSMQALNMEFLEPGIWHTVVDEAQIRLGGLLNVPGADNRPIYYEYECLVRNGRVINAQME
jgi:hypothetical protein